MDSDTRDTLNDCPVVAFTSPGGTGRTAAQVNAACILAAAGKQVLILDRGAQTPRVHDYLRPFQAEVIPPSQLLDDHLTMALFGPATGRDGLIARRYQLPMDAGGIDVIAFAGNPQQPYLGDGQDAALRNRIRAAGYDCVLIDIAAGATAVMAKRLAYLCDALVMCFHAQSSDVVKAAALAGEIAQLVPFRLEILATTLQFDDQDPGPASRTRDRIRTAFAHVASSSVSLRIVEIPYQPVNVVFDQAVEVLYDEPESPVPLAYAQITQAITMGEVDRMHPISPRARDSYRYSLGVGTLSAQPRIAIAYAAEDRLWVDWMQSLLRSSGAEVTRLPADESWLDSPVRPAVLVVASPRLAHSSTGRRAIELASAPGLAGRLDLLVVQLPDRAVGAPFDELPRISLADCDETQARRRLLRHFVLFDQLETRESLAYFPSAAATAHSRSNLPPRNGQFVGRGVVLEDMRDRFLNPEEPVVYTLTGSAGTGKSQIALEYAHRFTADYDLQWWISAQDEQSVRAGLTALADELMLPSTPDRPQAALEALRAHSPFRRWLLVYDNVADQDTLAELLPAADAGHVILTTRERSPDGVAIGGLDTVESVELLTNLVPDLVADDAVLVAAQMGQLPLALRLAAAWISESTTVGRQSVSTRAGAAAWAATEFRARVAGSLADQRERVPQAAALTVILGTLAEDDLGRVATRLAQLCSWLSPDAVALRMLRSPAMVRAVARAADDAQALVLDPLELDQVLCLGQRYGLFEMNWERPAKLTMHRVVQALLRDSMAPEERDERRQEVLRALAAFAPTDREPEALQDIADFVELQRHIEISEAVGSQDTNVRRWLVDHVNYLMRTQSPATWGYAVDLGEAVLAGWDPVSKAESSLRMRLEFQLVVLRRQRNDDPAAVRERVDDLLERQQRLLGPTHPRTLRSWRGRAEDLRRCGLFADACAAEQRTLHGSRAWLGDRHPDTRRAAGNLGWSYYLAGDLTAALALERENYQIRMALFGPDHLDVCFSVGSLAVYLRELGHYQEAIKILNEAIERVGAMRPDGDHPYELRLRWHRAIAYRNAGNPGKALEENAENLRRFHALFGLDDGRTVRCKLSFAIDYHLTGDSAAAVSFAEESLEGYHRSDPGYPNASLHLLNLAVFRRGLGELDRAFAISAQAVEELGGWLGASHPWTLAATINHAHAIALSGETARGRELLRAIHEECLEFLPPGHPYTRRAEAHLRSSGIADWGDLYVDLP